MFCMQNNVVQFLRLIFKFIHDEPVFSASTFPLLFFNFYNNFYINIKNIKNVIYNDNRTFKKKTAGNII